MSGEMPLRAVLPAYSAATHIESAIGPKPVYHLEALLKNHQSCHNYDPICLAVYSQRFLGERAFLLSEGWTYKFFGLAVSPSSAQVDYRKGYNYFNNVMNLRLSEVAALVLNQEFGAENISWNQQSDRIEVKAREGFILTLRGTNLIEAAAYLPRIYRSITSRLAMREIKEGVESVNVQIEGQAENTALAASPLRMSMRLPNFDNARPDDEALAAYLDDSVEASIKDALAHIRYFPH